MQSSIGNSMSTSGLNGFDKSLDELSNFVDCLKFREQELEQQHQLEFGKLKAEFDLQIQLEKKRVEQLQEINRTLTEELERGTQKQIDFDQKYTVILTKYNCSIEELKQIKDQHEKKRIRIEQLDKITQIFKNDKIKFEEDIKQLRTENECLKKNLEGVSPMLPSPPPPVTTHQGIPDELRPLVAQAVAENNELKKLLAERDTEIEKLNEQINRAQSEDPQLVEQRLSQSLAKLKSDFRHMFHSQTNFFLEKVDLLKQEQRDNIASLYKH